MKGHPQPYRRSEERDTRILIGVLCLVIGWVACDFLTSSNLADVMAKRVGAYSCTLDLKRCFTAVEVDPPDFQ